ncbi:MAG: YtxH domain-containing protein [Anaerolineae bacterium]|nr:YtxH domain-containing protein [Anaerolineae bacterium]MCO5203981.1 YtxH domain-containing protein [Anaerolineae bacterium]
MYKILGFVAGAMCGAVVGAAATLLLTPASGDELRNRAVNHWENTLSEARQAQAESRRTLESRFETMRYGRD